MGTKRKKISIIAVLFLLLILIGGGVLMFFFGVGKIENLESKIVTLNEPIKAVGLSVKTSVKTVFRDIPGVGKKYKNYKDKNGIPHRKEPWSFVAVSKDYKEETGTWEYILGDVVTNFDKVPKELISFEIPVGIYAVFPVRPKNIFVWGFTIAKTKDYVLETWSPKSKYELTGIDFEYHDERSTRKKNPEIDLYFAIKEKK